MSFSYADSAKRSKRPATFLVSLAVLGIATTCLGDKTWVQVPLGTQKDLRAVWGPSGNDVFVTSAAGTFYHYDGARWSTMPTDRTTASFNGIWGTGHNNVYAVGTGGTIWHYNGQQWSAQYSPTTWDLYGVWGSSGTDVYAVGDWGTILHYDGTRWSSIREFPFITLYGVWGSGPNDVYVVGGPCIIMHFDGLTWSTMDTGVAELGANSLLTMRGVWGTGANNVYIAGDGGLILHYDGHWRYNGDSHQIDLKAIRGASDGSVFAVGTQASYADFWNGSAWTSLSLNDKYSLYGVWTAGAANAYAVGNGGTLLHYAPVGTLQVATTPISGTIYIDGIAAGTGEVTKVLTIGQYVVSFSEVAGYIKPKDRIVQVREGQTTNVTGTYAGVGMLLVDTTPVKGTITVNNIPWGTAPEARNLPEGKYVIHFGTVDGYYTPPDQTVQVTRNNTTNATGTYVPLPPKTGTLIVDSQPVKGPVYVDNVYWGTAPEARVVAAGQHTIHFGDVTDYITPPDQQVTVLDNQTVGITTTYVEAQGTLLVATTPVSGEVFVDDSSWGFAPQGQYADVGTHTVHFGPVDGYTTPVDQTVSVTRDNVTSISGTYTPIPSGMGSLSVDTTPVKGEVFVDDVSWGTAPQSEALAIGSHTVTFGPVAGYAAPPAQNVTIQEGASVILNCAYSPLLPDVGVLTVTTDPVAGEVFVDDASWGAAPATGILSTGDHALHFSDVTGYLTPDDQVVTVAKNQVAMAKGTYTTVPPSTGVLSIDTVPPKGEVLVDGQTWGTAPEHKIVATGMHTVRFMEVAGFKTPDNQTVTVTDNATTQVVGTYTRLIPPTCMLTVQIDGQGQVQPQTGPQVQNAELTVLAAGDAVWHFDHWEGDLVGSSNPQTLTMDADKTIRAVFLKNPLIMPCSEYFGWVAVLVIGGCMFLLGARLRP